MSLNLRHMALMHAVALIGERSESNMVAVVSKRAAEEITVAMPEIEPMPAYRAPKGRPTGVAASRRQAKKNRRKK